MEMASCLIDTNILLRISRRQDPQHKVVDAALARLAERGTMLCYTLQNIAELWNAMTRPATLLVDNEKVYREWRRIVLAYSVSGVQVHDARLAAAMYAHGVSHILTLDIGDFSRFSGLTAVHPLDA
jgi:predicted nucleic acid-binding protein